MNLEKLRNDLSMIQPEAQRYFGSAKAYLERESQPSSRPFERLSPEIKQEANALSTNLAKIAADCLSAIQSSPLATEDDKNFMQERLRAMAAAIRLQDHWYTPARVVSERGAAYVAPAESRDWDAPPGEASKNFDAQMRWFMEKFDLLLPGPETFTRAIVQSEVPQIRKYRPNTAFIIMQINRGIPKLEDVKNSCKEVFSSFGITALRSDEIEHQDVITQRILDEIATSEYLFADLTGERPSVYYEVGYAHALDRRPILFREKGTTLHFDLLVHNVPEYENITDLKRQLTNRLLALTGRNPERK